MHTGHRGRCGRCCWRRHCLTRLPHVFCGGCFSTRKATSATMVPCCSRADTHNCVWHLGCARAPSAATRPLRLPHLRCARMAPGKTPGRRRPCSRLCARADARSGPPAVPLTARARSAARQLMPRLSARGRTQRRMLCSTPSSPRQPTSANVSPANSKNSGQKFKITSNFE